MRTTPLTLSLATTVLLIRTASSRPQLSYVPKGQCSYVGQFICVSDTTFAFCDSSLTGIIQPLALGDMRCAAPQMSSTSASSVTSVAPVGGGLLPSRTAGSTPVVSLASSRYDGGAAATAGQPTSPGGAMSASVSLSPSAAPSLEIYLSAAYPSTAPSSSAVEPSSEIYLSAAYPLAFPSAVSAGSSAAAVPTLSPSSPMYSIVYSTSTVISTVGGAYTTTIKPSVSPIPPASSRPSSSQTPMTLASPSPATSSPSASKKPASASVNASSAKPSATTSATDPGNVVVPVTTDAVVPVTTAGPHGSTHGGAQPGS